MKLSYMTVITVAAISGCAQVPLNKPTASGMAEATYNAPISKVKSAIAAICSQHGSMVETETDHSIVCAKEDTSSSGLFLQATLTNGYSTPMKKLKFTLSSSGEQTRVWVRSSIDVQLASGQMNSTPLNGNRVINTQQLLLDTQLKSMVEGS